MKVYRYLSILVFVLAVQPASAIIVNYDLIALGGSSYRYEYTVTNDGSLGAGVPVESFALIFNSTLYDETSLVIVTTDPPASEWDEQIFGTGLLVEPAYDALALAGGIADGSSVFGFAVQFDWLGAGTPGPQPFEVYDPNTFDLVETGVTRSAGTSIPEPNTLLLFLLSVVAAGISRRRMR